MMLVAGNTALLHMPYHIVTSTLWLNLRPCNQIEAAHFVVAHVFMDDLPHHDASHMEFALVHG